MAYEQCVAGYPQTEPYDRGWLDVGDGHRVFWVVSGNPDGAPVLLLHGGPGSGLNARHRRHWDPARYRIVQFDQRGCGASTPRASDPATDLTANTTGHLVTDIERLRVHLGVERWVVAGVSWGVTLALVYAETHPARVRALALSSVTMTRRSDVHWLYHQTGRFLPEAWATFRAGVPIDERDGDLIAAYDRLLNRSNDPAVQHRAARDWCDWEDAAVSLVPGWTPDPRYADADFRMQFARIVTHYFAHGAWLSEGQLLHDAGRLAGIPGVLVHGRLDIGSPADVPWLLAAAWPDAQLHLVGTAGHGGNDETDEILTAAADGFVGN